MIDETSELLLRRVSHAVLNDLAVVRLLLDSARDPGMSPATVDNLARASSRIGEVADTLAQLSALACGAGGPVAVDLREVVGRVDRLLDVAAGPAATVRSSLPEVPVVVEVDVREAQHNLLSDVASLGGSATPGATITVAVAEGGITIVCDD
jgi:hypothetical protein